MFYASNQVELPPIDFTRSEVNTSTGYPPRLEASAGTPNHLLVIVKKYLWSNHVACVFIQAFLQLFQQGRPKFRIIVDQQNRIAASFERSSNALVISFSYAEIGLVTNQDDSGIAVFLYLLDRAIYRGVIHDVEQEI